MGNVNVSPICCIKNIYIPSLYKTFVVIYNNSRMENNSGQPPKIRIIKHTNCKSRGKLHINLKMDGWNTSFLLGQANCRGYVGFRGGIFQHISTTPISSIIWPTHMLPLVGGPLPAWDPYPLEDPWGFAWDSHLDESTRWTLTEDGGSGGGNMLQVGYAIWWIDENHV